MAIISELSRNSEGHWWCYSNLLVLILISAISPDFDICTSYILFEQLSWWNVRMFISFYRQQTKMSGHLKTFFTLNRFTQPTKTIKSKHVLHDRLFVYTHAEPFGDHFFEANKNIYKKKIQPNLNTHTIFKCHIRAVYLGIFNHHNTIDQDMD